MTVTDRIVPLSVTLLRSELHVLRSVAGMFPRKDQLEREASSQRQVLAYQKE